MKIIKLLFALLLIFTPPDLSAQEVPATFKNPILPGFNPDPSICRVGDDYYLIISSFTWFPGIPIYHSRDLVNWKVVGHGIHRPNMIDMNGLDDNDGIWAVTIRHHDGLFYLITTASKSGGNFYITATDPKGPWSDPVWLKDAPEIDQMFTSGVNHVYFHGTTYSPKNVSWPGWKFYESVDMSPTNPFWQDASSFFNYISRVQSFLQSGIPDNDFLFYFPVYDIWDEQRGNYFTTFSIHGMRKRLSRFFGGVKKIMSYGYDLDYISDHYIQNSFVENGLLKTIGGTTYKALVMPAVKNIPLETISHIRNLAEQGATIIFMENYPSDVPGLSNIEERRNRFTSLMKEFPIADSFEKVSVRTLGKGKILAGNNYEEVLSNCKVNNESFVSEIGGQLIRRKHEKGHHYFMTLLKNNPVNGWITLGINAQSAMFFDPLTGKKGQAAIRNQNGRTQVYLQLQPGESILLKTFTDVSINAKKWSYYQPTGSIINLEKGWQLSFTKSEPAISGIFALDFLGSWTELNNEDMKKIWRLDNIG